MDELAEFLPVDDRLGVPLRGTNSSLGFHDPANDRIFLVFPSRFPSAELTFMGVADGICLAADLRHNHPLPQQCRSHGMEAGYARQSIHDVSRSQLPDPELDAPPIWTTQDSCDSSPRRGDGSRGLGSSSGKLARTCDDIRPQILCARSHACTGTPPATKRCHVGAALEGCDRVPFSFAGKRLSAATKLTVKLIGCRQPIQHLLWWSGP